MRDFGDSQFDREPSVDAIRWTDSFVDALAGGRPVAPQDPADAELAALLGEWRDDMRWPPATGLIRETDAIVALNAGRAEKRSLPGRDRIAALADAPVNPRKNRRGLSVVGAAAAAVLCIGGFGAVVAGAGPGDSLYGLRTMLFGESKQVRGDQVGLAAKTELNQVQDLIEQGNWDQAQDKLVAVSTQVANVGDEEQKQQLLDQFNDLSAKVVERDPAATAPPGVIYTVPPSAAELVPAVAPSTSTTASESTTAPATTSTTTAPESTSATTTAPATTAGTTADTSAPASPSSTATSPAPTSASTASQSESATQSVPTTTPTSAAPSPAETTAAPAVQSETPAAPTTTPAAPATPATPSAAAETPSEAPVEPKATETVETPVPSAAVTTTVVLPVPAA